MLTLDVDFVPNPDMHKQLKYVAFVFIYHININLFNDKIMIKYIQKSSTEYVNKEGDIHHSGV